MHCALHEAGRNEWVMGCFTYEVLCLYQLGEIVYRGGTTKSEDLAFKRRKGKGMGLGGWWSRRVY
jgi:hypothetical protein